MANETPPFNPGDYFTDDEAVKVRTHYQIESARLRHDDWDERLNSHKWTNEQTTQVETHEGDAAEFAYNLAKDASTVSAEQLYDGDGGPAPEPADPDSPEAIYDGA